MSQDSATLEIVDSINLQQENFFDTSSSQDVNKEIGKILSFSQKEAVSDKIEKLLFKYFEEEILNVIIDCHKDNWDGYGSKKISELSIAKARVFCYNAQISELLSKPHISLDPDGYVMFTWQYKKDILSVIVQPNDTVVFSLIIGSDRMNALLSFYQGKVPAIINEKLKELSKKCLRN